MDILISEGYLLHFEYPAYVDETPNEASLEKNLKGKVEFDLGELKDPISGELVRIQGEFPRIKPRHEREEVTSEEFQELNTKLTVWVDSFFETKNQSKYFEDLIDTATLLSLFGNPFHQVEQDAMELLVISIFWMWHADDFLEMAIKHNVPFGTLEKGIAQLLQVLEDEQAEEFTAVEGCPGFRPLFNSLTDLHTRLEKHHQDYKDVSEPLRFYLRRYFEAMKWYAVERIQGAYSEETFIFWRRIISYFDGIAQVIMMVNRINLPKKILTSPLLRRILDIVNSGGFINDILGLTKELEHGQVDNLIIFKVEEKGIPLKEAVAQVCELVKNEHTDYILLRDAILFKFSNDPELVKCIDVLESLMDGHCLIYTYSERHFSAGKIKLTR